MIRKKERWVGPTDSPGLMAEAVPTFEQPTVSDIESCRPTQTSNAQRGSLEKRHYNVRLIMEREWMLRELLIVIVCRGPAALFFREHIKRRTARIRTMHSPARRAVRKMS